MSNTKCHYQSESWMPLFDDTIDEVGLGRSSYIVWALFIYLFNICYLFHSIVAPFLL